MFTGCGTALVTPFKADGSLDEATLRKLVRRQIEQGIDYLVPCGTTGESPTLADGEHLRVVEITIEESKGKVPVLAGAGSNNTHHAVHLTKEVTRLAADGVLVVTPYYNKPTQEGLVEHYREVASATKLPIIVYSVQPRTNVNIEPATMVRLANISNIIGVKEASGSVAQVAAIIKRVPNGFLVVSGDDSVTLPVISLGGKGIISVVSNEIPGDMTKLAQYALKGDYESARKLQNKYQLLMEINFIESSPGPVKAAMEMMGLMEAHYRLPVVKPKPESLEKIRSVLQDCGLLEQRSLSSVG